MATVATTLNYKHPDTPYEYYPGTALAYTIPRDHLPVNIHDARGKESDFTLDKNGFEFHSHTSKAEISDDKEAVSATYYPELEALLKERTGATRVIPVDHLVRRDTYDSVRDWAKTANPTDRVEGGKRVPARFVHIDQSYEGAHVWLHDNVSDKELAEKLKRTRWGIINVWRPLKRVTRDPLGVCDGSTVEDSDLTGSMGIIKNFKEVSRGGGFEFWVLKRPDQEGAHKWYYWSGMSPDEVMLIRCFDTKLDGRCRRAPHSAFEDNRFLEDAPRESIEVRCLVFWEDQAPE